MADDVRLVDLELIQRYSIAVRGETADRAELLATLRADLAWLQGRTSGSRDSAGSAADEPATERPRATKRRAAVPKPAPAKRAAKPAPARSSAPARTTAAAKKAKAPSKPMRRGR